MQDNFFSQMVLFESFLVEFKRDTLKSLRLERKERQESLLVINNLINKEASKNQLELLKSQLEQLRLNIEHLNYQIEILDLTVDKFWDELFAIYDWILEKERSFHVIQDPNLKNQIEKFTSQIPALLDRYILLIEYGYSIHLLRGKPLKLESKALEMVFDKLRSNPKIFIITVIGEQSSAKSSLMNALFGCDFRTSAGRCTVGIYMNFVTCKEKTIVILDSEGLMSIESGNNVLDNQLATMAVLSSHLIIINHKGEISTNLERLLGITFYAKLHTYSSKFTPSILFVLRDQTNRNSTAVKSQAAELKMRLMNQVGKINKSIDEVMNIDTNNIVLLPNAFAEDINNDKTVKWRNRLFPEEILELRRKFLNILHQMNINGHEFNKLSDLYSSMSSYWKIMQDLGDGILYCKDLEEIKNRNELTTKSSKIQEKNVNEFQEICNKQITEIKEKLTKEGRFDDSIKEQIRYFLDDTANSHCKQVQLEFNANIRPFKYPEDLIKERETNVKENIQRLKIILLNDWNSYCTEKKETHLLNNAQQTFVKKVSDLILSGESSSLTHFNKEIEKIITEFDENKNIESLYQKDEYYIEGIQNLYNKNQKTYIFDSKFKRFECFPYFDDLKEKFTLFHGFQNKLEELIFNWIELRQIKNDALSKLKGYMCKFAGRENLNEKTTLDFFRNKLANFVLSKVLTEIIPEARRSINSCQVEDNHIRNSLSIINTHIFNKDSPILAMKNALIFQNY